MENQITRYKPEEIIPLENLPQTRQQAVMLMSDSPMPYWNSLKPRSFKDVFKSCDDIGLTLVGLSSEFGDMKINALMFKWLKKFVEFFSTSGTMGAEQIAETINLIREEYPHFTMDDMKLFFNQAKKGEFGEVYRMDGNVILTWMKKYAIARASAAENESISSQDKFKPLYNGDFIPESIGKDENIERANQGYKNLMEAMNKRKKFT